MKRNRYIIAYVLLAFCFIKHPVVGQNRSFTGTVTIHPVRLEQVGDSLYIEMDMVLEDVKMIGFLNWFLHHVLLIYRVFH